MYGKYALFYESPKNWGYYVHAQTVCTRPLLGREMWVCLICFVYLIRPCKQAIMNY